jgi:hypothetical protein
VTGMDLPSSSKNWDMPSFFPRMPMDISREKRQQDHHSAGVARLNRVAQLGRIVAAASGAIRGGSGIRLG